jgi:hypothetical protein
MPALAGLTDEEIARVLSFIRTKYGNIESPVTVEEVTIIRKATADRSAPWSTLELSD